MDIDLNQGRKQSKQDTENWKKYVLNDVKMNIPHTKYDSIKDGLF